MENTTSSKQDETIIKANAVLADSFEIELQTETQNEQKTLTWSDISNKIRIATNNFLFSLNESKTSPNLYSKIQKRDIHIYSDLFQCIKNSTPEIANQTKTKLLNKLNEIIYFCYRKNFPPIYSNKTFKTSYTSDSGWGCMIRCSQMLISKALYEIFKQQDLSTQKALYTSIIYFLEYPFQLENIPSVFIPVLNNFLKQICLKDQTSPIYIKSMTPPFSIKNLCYIGELFHKSAGEWFSDVNLANIYNIINTNFKCFDKISFLPFLTTIVKETIINECFISNENDVIDKNDAIKLQDDSVMYFYKAGIVLVSVRLGIDKIAQEYYDNIKEMFDCKQCIGIIGGKRGFAYYFVGYDSKYLYYLDPHVTKDSLKKDRKPQQIVKHYLEKDFHWMTLNDLQPAFTVGFVFRNGQEWKELMEWLEEKAKKEFAVFGFTEKNYPGYNMSEDELIETYDLKMEDDF